jgi:hypothetical protein
MPWVLAIGGKPFLSTITPALRYSELSPEFTGNKFQQSEDPDQMIPEDLVGRDIYPAPSVWWDWRKWDAGLNFALVPGMVLTVEYSDGKFLRAGNWENADEFLVTYTWRKLP